MAMSIAERMARQAMLKNSAGKTGPSPTAGGAGAALSVADRMRKQATYKASVSMPAPATAPSDQRAMLSVAERIARAAAAKRREMNGGMGGMSGASNEAIIAKYREEYQKFLAQLDTMDFGSMFFNPAEPEEKKETPADVAANANGISTSEGEAVMEVVSAESEGRLNEVPVTVPEEKTARPKRSRRAKTEKPAEEKVEAET